MTVKMGRYVTLALALYLLGGAFAVAQTTDCKGLAQNANVVEVSLDKVNRVGSGVLLTFEGHIITAAHLLDDGMDPPRLQVYVRLHDADEYVPARILRVEDQLDLALLRAETPVPQFRPISAAVERDVREGRDVTLCLSGFPISKGATGATVEEEFSSVPADYIGDRLGYFFVSWPAEDGFSGGGAFLDGALAGMIVRRKTPNGTFILSIDYIEAMVDESGVEIGAERRFEPGIAASQMNQRITNNARLIDENRQDIDLIFRSMEWNVALRGSDPSNLVLVLTAQPALPAQIFDGYMIITIYPYFSSDTFQAFVNAYDPLGEEIGKNIPENGIVVIDDLIARIDNLRTLYLRKGVNVTSAPLEHVRIEGGIYFGTQEDVVAAIKHDVAIDGYEEKP